MLLLKGDKAPVNAISLCPRDVVQRILVDRPRAILLADLFLKFRKLDKKVLLQNAGVSKDYRSPKTNPPTGVLNVYVLCMKLLS